MLQNRRTQYVLVAIGAAVVGAVVGLVLAPVGSESPVGDRVVITNGAGVALPAELPLKADLAAAAGWTDLVRCFKGRGRYFEKLDAQGTPGPYLLMYDNDDELIGVHLVSRTEMPVPPWEHAEDGLLGVTNYEFVQWSLPVYFKRPVLACGPAGAGQSSVYDD